MVVTAAERWPRIIRAAPKASALRFDFEAEFFSDVRGCVVAEFRGFSRLLRVCVTGCAKSGALRFALLTQDIRLTRKALSGFSCEPNGDERN